MCNINVVKPADEPAIVTMLCLLSFERYLKKYDDGEREFALAAAPVACRNACICQ